MIISKFKVSFLIIFILSVQILSANSINDINIRTENYPPFNYMDENNTLKGISIEVLSLMLKKLDSNVSIKDIKFLPWARAYKQTLHDNNGMIFSIMRTWQREKEFKWVGPISTKTVVLLAKKDKNIKLHSLKDAKKYKTGVILNDIGDILLEDRGFDLDKVGGLNAIKILANKLNSNKIDLLAYSYQSDIQHNDILDKFKIVYKLKEDGLYFAFNKAISEKVVQKFQNALDLVKKESKYQKIFNKYLNY